MTSGYLKRIAAALLTIAIPLALITAYRTTNHRYQRNDDSFHLQLVQNHYFSIKEHGLLKGGEEAYLDRFFHPVLHPYLAVPLLFATGGKTDLTVTINVIANYAVFILFVWLLLSEYLEGADLVLATLVITLIPTTIAQTQGIRSELTALATFTGFLFFLKRSDLLSSRKYTLLSGVFLGLSICARPVETLMTGGVLCIPIWVYAIKRKNLVSRDLLIFALMSALVVASWCYQNREQAHDQNLSYLLFALVPIPFFAFRKRLGLSENSFLFFGAAYLLTVLWYAPVARQLVDWVAETTFSESLKTKSYRTGVSIWNFFGHVADYASWPVLGGLLGLGGIQFLFFRQDSLPAEQAKRVKPGVNTAWVVLPAVLLPPLFGSISYNGDPKEYLFGDVLAYLLVLVLLSTMKTKVFPIWNWIKRSLMALIVLFLVFYRVAFIRADYPTIDAIEQHLPGPELLRPVAHDAIEEDFQIFSRHLKHHPVGQDLRVCLYQMRQFNDLDWVADPNTLTVMARERGEKWYFDWVSPWILPTLQERYAYGKEKCDYIFVLPIEHKPAPIAHFSSDVGEIFLAAWKENRLKSEGLRYQGARPVSE